MPKSAKHKKNKKRASGAPSAPAATQPPPQPTPPQPDSGAPRTSLLKLARFQSKASSGPALSRILVPPHVLAATAPRLPRSPPRSPPPPRTPPRTQTLDSASELQDAPPPAPRPWEPVHDLGSTAADVVQRTDHVRVSSKGDFRTLLKGLAYRVRVSTGTGSSATLTAAILDYSGVETLYTGLEQRGASALVRHPIFRHSYVLEFDENLTRVHIDWLRSPTPVAAQVIRVLTTGNSDENAAIYNLPCPFVFAPSALNLTFMANSTPVSPSSSSSAGPTSSSPSPFVHSDQILAVFEGSVKFTRPCDVRVYGGTLVDPEGWSKFDKYGRFA